MDPIEYKRFAKKIMNRNGKPAVMNRMALQESHQGKSGDIQYVLIELDEKAYKIYCTGEIYQVETMAEREMDWQ